MRLSADSDDPGHDSWKRMFATVTLDGVQQFRAITADEELGLVLRYKVDDNLDPVLDPLTQDFATETVYGVVKITIQEK